MTAIWAELDCMDPLPMAFHSVDQAAGLRVPKTDVLTEMPKDSCAIEVPGTHRAFNTLPPQFRGWQCRLCLYRCTYQGEERQARQDPHTDMPKALLSWR